MPTESNSLNSSEIRYSSPAFAKWAGGKTQLLKQLHPLMPSHFKRYIEPFLGSGAVFFFVKRNLQPEETILSDNLGDLINCYEVVRGQVEELISDLRAHELNHAQDYYYFTRSLDPIGLTDLQKASRFLYLNKTCFNGLYRVNSKGEFNVPIGAYKKPNIVNADSLRAASRLLRDATIQEHDFADSILEARNDDFVYLDPPYYPLSTTANFTGYTRNVFLESEQRRLYATYQELDHKGCLLMQSNSDTEFIRKLYDGFRIETVQARRSINSDASKRGKISELVILNY